MSLLPSQLLLQGEKLFTAPTIYPNAGVSAAVPYFSYIKKELAVQMCALTCQKSSMIQQLEVQSFTLTHHYM